MCKIADKKQLPSKDFERLYIETGYRPINKSWLYYLKSIFQLHNETLNIWTHLLAFLWFIYKCLDLSIKYDLVHDPKMQPMGAGLIGMATVFLGSTFAHWFSDSSISNNYVCFFIDYMGISLYGLGASFLTHNYCIKNSSLHFSLMKYSETVIVVLAILAHFTFCYCKCEFGLCLKTKYLRLITNGSQYIWFLVPLADRFWDQAERVDEHMHLHITHFIVYVFTGAVFKLHMPERWCPKTFDIVGQSHQVFHLGIWIIAYLTIEGVIRDLDNKPLYVISRPYEVFFFTFAIELLLVIIFSYRVRQKLRKKMQLQKDESSTCKT